MDRNCQADKGRGAEDRGEPQRAEDGTWGAKCPQEGRSSRRRA